MRRMRTLLSAMAGIGLAIAMMTDTRVLGGEGEKCPHGKSMMAKDTCCPADSGSSQAGFTPELQRATKLHGMPVTNMKGQDLGTLEHLAIDTERSQVVYGIISRGGMLNIGDKDTAVPWRLVRGSAEGDRLIAFVSKDKLMKAENMTDQRLARLDDQQWAESTHEHFGVSPYWETARAEAGRCPWHKDQQGASYDRTRRDKSDMKERGGQRSKLDQAGPNAETTVDARDAGDPLAATGDQRERSLAENQGRSWPVNRSDRDFGKRGSIILHDVIIGSKVKNPQDEELGEISDLMVDLQNGTVGYAVLGHGGVLGIGQKLTAVPMELLDFQSQSADDHPTIVANMSREKFENAPGFEGGNWPDMTSRSWNQDIHTYYGGQPYYVIYGFVIAPAEGDRYTRGFAQGKQVFLHGTVLSIEQKGYSHGLEQGGVQIEFKVEQEMSPESPARGDASSLRNQNQDQTDVNQERTGSQSGERGSLQGRTITVNLAPQSFLKQHNLDLGEGAQVTIRGFLSSQGAREEVVAQTIQKSGGQSVILRTADGHPMWSVSLSDHHRDQAKDLNRSESESEESSTSQ